MPTAQEFLYDAFRLCGQMRPGYQNGPELLNDGLRKWRDFFDTLNASRTGSYSTPDYIYPVVTTGLAGIYGPSVQFTIGPVFTFSGVTVIGSRIVTLTDTSPFIIGQYVTAAGVPALSYITAISPGVSITLSANATLAGARTFTCTPDFVGPRPTEILKMNMWMTETSPSAPSRLPLTRIWTAEEFADISVLQMTAVNVTTCYWYNPTWPQATINVFPPLNGNSLEIFTWGFLDAPLTLSSNYSAPAGYAEAIKNSLAARLWPLCTNQIMVNKVTHQWICAQAKIAVDRIKGNNAPKQRLVSDFGGGLRSGSGVGVCDWGLLFTGIPY